MSQMRSPMMPSAKAEASLPARTDLTGCPWHDVKSMLRQVGLLRQVAVDGSKAYFDTNASAHHHFFVEGEDELLDIPGAEVLVGKAPAPPEGYEISRVDVVVRLRRKK